MTVRVITATVYSGRREAGLVMTSLVHVATRFRCSSVRCRSDDSGRVVGNSYLTGLWKGCSSTGSNCDHFPLLIPPGKLDSFRLAIREWIDSVNTTAFILQWIGCEKGGLTGGPGAKS